MCAVIAIHGSLGFAKRWGETGARLGHTVKNADGYRSDIIGQLAVCDAFLWQISHDEVAELHYARSVLLAAEQMGLRVFPNHATCWHFDDKIAQKYLLESIGAPLADSWVFYSKKDALQFLDGAAYPLVFKLRRGAGSLNVRLVRDRPEGAALVGRMFGRGMRMYPPAAQLKRIAARASKHGRTPDPVRIRAKRVVLRFLRQTLYAPRERGYVLFQRFVPHNDRDIRVTVIGERAFVFFRRVRAGDFRASGSGLLMYPDPKALPIDCVRVAFDISRRVGFQSMAYDFVLDTEGTPSLLEISYSYLSSAVFECRGFLDTSLGWNPAPTWPEDAILIDLLQ